MNILSQTDLTNINNLADISTLDINIAKFEENFINTPKGLVAFKDENDNIFFICWNEEIDNIVLLDINLVIVHTFDINIQYNKEPITMALKYYNQEYSYKNSNNIIDVRFFDLDNINDRILFSEILVNGIMI